MNLDYEDKRHLFMLADESGTRHSLVTPVIDKLITLNLVFKKANEYKLTREGWETVEALQ